MFRHLRKRCLLLICALPWVLGCGSEAEPSETPSVLVLGTGEASFESFPADEHLTLHAGTQGGHHVWLSMRAQGLDPDGIRMVLEVIPEKPAPEARSEVLIDFTKVVDDGGETDLTQDAGNYEGWVEFVGWPARVLAPECTPGKRVRLKVSLEDEHGRTAHASSELIVDAPKAGFQTACDL